MVTAGAFDIEDDADCHSRFVDKTPVFPVDDRWPIGSVRGGLARIGTMAEHTTPEAEGGFGVVKGLEGVLIQRFVGLVIWGITVRGRAHSLRPGGVLCRHASP